MPKILITLPDQSQREYESGVTGLEVAESIGKSLAKDAVAVSVNNELWDLTRPISNDAEVSVITRNSEEGLDILRHDAAHILAEAAKEIYPQIQVTIGPSIENGFYYDFHREEPFTPDDLETIEARMHEIVARNESIRRDVWERDQAIDYFKGIGENFKAEIISDLPKEEPLTVYTQGNFTDLCRGPHLPSTGQLGKGFKLLKVSGAYWRGDSNNPMLQRIYGTAWANEKDLKTYLHQREEAEKRDHRRLGKQMDLFHLQDVAVGSIFWHPRGWRFYRILQDYIREKLDCRGYQEVRTPQLVDRRLWEKSGHWEKFREGMFTVENENEREQALKPMNCPCHVEIFKQGMKSYRDLPLRMAEFGMCHRNEPSGSLHGLMRVRGFMQDDAHIFCREDQISAEVKVFCDLLLDIYKDFGFTDVSVKFSDRPKKRAGSDKTWDRAEKALLEATQAAGLETVLNPGEGAFYGPKLEFVLKDAIGRSWQCGTMQVDFVLPERLEANYIAEDGQKRHPVMLHRAVFGSFERFIAILIEHYEGRFPLWLAPVQIAVTPITNAFDGYAEDVAETMKAAGLRVITDLRNEKVNYRIRDLSHQKIPVIAVVGEREKESSSVTLRRLGTKKQETIALSQAVDKLVIEKQHRNM